VVILMQENRSFDHYFGTLQGVRGFSDKQALTYQSGTSIFDQPDKSRTDLGYLLPFLLDSTKVDAQNAGDLDHSWSGDHSARNSGLWNDWVAAKTEQCMGYFTRAAAGLTKAGLAHAISSEPATVRRLFSSSHVNPTLGTLAEVAAALGMRVVLEPLDVRDQEQITRPLIEGSTDDPRALAARIDELRNGHLVSTIDPPRPPAIRCGIPARAVCHSPVRLMSMVSFQLSGAIDSTGPPMLAIPALATTMSRRPSCATPSSTTALTASRSRTSAWAATAR
jgi:transcriptional regulator with XRE-family HTH domain